MIKTKIKWDAVNEKVSPEIRKEHVKIRLDERFNQPLLKISPLQAYLEEKKYYGMVMSVLGMMPQKISKALQDFFLVEYQTNYCQIISRACI